MSDSVLQYDTLKKSNPNLNKPRGFIFSYVILWTWDHSTLLVPGYLFTFKYQLCKYLHSFKNHERKVTYNVFLILHYTILSCYEVDRTYSILIQKQSTVTCS